MSCRFLTYLLDEARANADELRAELTNVRGQLADARARQQQADLVIEPDQEAYQLKLRKLATTKKGLEPLIAQHTNAANKFTALQEELKRGMKEARVRMANAVRLLWLYSADFSLFW